METIKIILPYAAIVVISGLFMVNAIKIAKHYFNNDISYIELVLLCLINGCCIAALIQLIINLLTKFYL